MRSTKIEALTAAQRLKAKANFRRNKSKIALGRKRAEKRVASTEKLKARAKKAARREVEKKLLRNKDKGELSFAARQSLEKRVDKKKPMIDRLAKRLLPTLKKKEMEKRRSPKKESFHEKLTPSMPVTDWIDDFLQSDAPQFQGKTKKEKINMAVAAHRSAQ